MKPIPVMKTVALRLGQFLALWVGCMLMTGLYWKWRYTQPEYRDQGGPWGDFAFQHLSYSDIAMLGALDALLFFLVWRVGVAIYRRFAR